MWKLYSTDGPAAVTDPETGELVSTDEDDALIASDALYAALAPVHVNGKKLWENEVERDERLVREEYERRRDPATLLDAVAALQAGAAARELTADELREAEEERKRIKAEREAEAEADRERERERLEEDARLLAERQRIAAENAELDRLEAERQAAADAAARDTAVDDANERRAEAEDDSRTDDGDDASVGQTADSELPPPPADEPPLEKLDRPGLDEVARGLGLEPGDFRNKGEVIAAINDARAKAEPPTTPTE